MPFYLLRWVAPGQRPKPAEQVTGLILPAQEQQGSAIPEQRVRARLLKHFVADCLDAPRSVRQSCYEVGKGYVRYAAPCRDVAVDDLPGLFNISPLIQQPGVVQHDPDASFFLLQAVF